MAEPILLKLPPRDPREALYQRLENAPREHAEALLASYDVLQGLHDRGVLELLKGAIGSSEKLLQILVETGNSPAVIRGIRNLAILAKIGDSIDPEFLEALERAVPGALAEARKTKPLGWWQLMKKLCGRSTRRVLTATACIFESVGNNLDPKKPH